MISRWILAFAGLAVASAHATDVNVIGLFTGKAVIVIDRGAPRTISAGETTAEGVKLISADSKGAVLEIDGKRQTLEMGQHFESAAQTASRTSVTLPADSGGQFIADGMVNGVHMRFMIDTGATYVSIPASEAARLGIDFRKGKLARSLTANGPVEVYRVTLDSVTLGDVTLFNVEGVVHQSPGLNLGLLGMSFLGRMEMRREGGSLTLIKRF